MKLLLCANCSDVVKLTSTLRECQCGKCGGVARDGLNADVYGGDNLFVLGIANDSLLSAILAQLREGDLAEPMGGIYGKEVKGREFAAFIIPNSAPTVRRIDSEFRHGD